MSESICIYEEYRLIERNEEFINRAWKGAHLLLFFLAFVFGSFCTFCFHMLMYLFDEKCVLFPKLLSLTSLRHNVIYELLPPSKDYSDLPVDFVSTQWVEKSSCVLPTYVPLISGIFGLVWTTMFLMCSTGTRTLTGLQRPWRVLPPVFTFSLAMSILCIYSSTVTHYGLQELCVKLAEITGSSTCSYTVNVVTLAYERRIRGVYQATRLTIASAWLHTGCWICSCFLAVVRVVLAIDFQLVRISVNLHADIDRLMDRNETQLRSISPEDTRTRDSDELTVFLSRSSSTLFDDRNYSPNTSLVSGELRSKTKSPSSEPKDNKKYFRMQYNLDDNTKMTTESATIISSVDNYETINIAVKHPQMFTPSEDQRLIEGEQRAIVTTIHECVDIIEKLVYDFFNSLIEQLPQPTTSKKISDVSVITTVEAKGKLDEGQSQDDLTSPNQNQKSKKSNIKNVSTQTDTNERKDKTKEKRVYISDSLTNSDTDNEDSAKNSKNKVDKEMQAQSKEKQD